MMHKKLKSIVMAAIMIASIFATFTPTLGDWREPPPAGDKEAIYYLGPDNSSASEFCENTTVQVWVNSTIPFFGGHFTITTDDASCGNIVIGSYVGNLTYFDAPHAIHTDTGSVLEVEYVDANYAEQPPGVYNIGEFKIHCNSPECCKTDLIFGVRCTWPPCVYITNVTGDKVVAMDNGTFTCGEPTEESFSKDLYEGWNLVSLPLTLSNNSASSVLASVWNNVSAVYRYNATSKQFESASTMDPGEGYFVHVTQNCTWTYSGTPYTSMSTELKQGLNMVGWLNCSKDISDALSPIEGNYWYVARWNAVSQSFEVYNPVAPSSFNDFTAMDRGTGYFISAKADTTLSASC